MKFENVRGSIVAMITPFHEDGSVNFEALTHLIERQIAGGTSAILTLGTTGEYSTMTHEEDAAVVRHTRNAADPAFRARLSAEAPLSTVFHVPVSEVLPL